MIWMKFAAALWKWKAMNLRLHQFNKPKNLHNPWGKSIYQNQQKCLSSPK